MVSFFKLVLIFQIVPFLVNASPQSNHFKQKRLSIVPAISMIGRNSTESFMPDWAYLEIAGWKYETGGGTEHYDWVYAYFDTSGELLYAGDASLDGQNIPWYPSDSAYYLDYSQGFRYQVGHLYNVRFTGSSRVPPYSDTITAKGPDINILSPRPGETVDRSRGLRIAWQPRGDSTTIELWDTLGYYLQYTIPDTGSIFVPPAQLESLALGEIDLTVYRINVQFRSPGYDFMMVTGIVDELLFNLAVGIEESVNRYRFRKNLSLTAYPQPASDKARVCFSAPENEQVAVDLFDHNGRKLCTVYEGMSAKNQTVLTLNLRDRLYQRLPSGVYFLGLTNKKDRVITKFLILK